MAENLIDVEEFGDFEDLPELHFDGSEEVVYKSGDIEVLFLEIDHYAVYRSTLLMLPPSRPDSVNYHVFDIHALRGEGKKVFKIYDGNMDEITLGRGTYEIGLNFSGGRVYADSHFLKRYYH